jgi:hypothetical protein
MRLVKLMLTARVPVFALGACTPSLSDADRAAITSANQNAEAAQRQSAAALKTSQSAQQSADAAAADAKAANEKADRMFQRNLRK